MIQKVHSPVGTTVGLMAFGFLLAAAVLGPGTWRNAAFAAWLVLSAVAVVAFTTARHRGSRAVDKRWVRDAHLVVLGAFALVVAVVWGSGFGGAVGAGATFVFAASVTGWIAMPRLRGRQQQGRL